MVQKVNIKKIILTTVATVGLLAVVVLAPNALQVIKQFSKKDERQKKYYLNKSIQKLLKDGFVEIETKNGKKYVRLTKKGEEQLVKYELGDLEIKTPKKWDKKWRMIIFDIKEKRRKTRDILRSTLNRLGFIKLQNSV